MKTIKVIDIFNLVDQLQKEYKMNFKDIMELYHLEQRKNKQLQQENSELKRKLELKSGLVLARQNIKFCNENTKLQQEKEDLIKWFQDNLKALENMPFAISKSAVIKEFEEGLSKLKGDDKE